MKKKFMKTLALGLSLATALGYLAVGSQTQKHWNCQRVPVCTD